MYLALYDCLYYFVDCYGEPVYFNFSDYHFYEYEERQSLVNQEVYAKNDFIPVPKISIDEIMKEFLTGKKNIHLLRMMGSKDFTQKFYWYIEDNRFVEEFNAFEKLKIMDFAVQWCNTNGINYSCKSGDSS